MIRLENLNKTFETRQGRTVAVDDVSLHVPEGRICILLGPSGCGKTTTLKMVNRLIAPTHGRIFIDGQDTSDHDAITLRRNMGYVIQQIGLFPNMTVAENIGVVPRMLGWAGDRIRRRAEELLEMMALDPGVFGRRYPAELSGGQQQRIGVARALAADPPVLLMDEPFGALDPISREAIQDEFLKMQAGLGKTILFVSHDIDEAVKMGDMVAIFREGRIEQADTPDRILAYPANDFVAEFVGRDRSLKRLSLACVHQAMCRKAPRLRAGIRLDEARRLLASTHHTDAAVVDERERVVGVARQDGLGGSGALNSAHWRPAPAVAHPSDDLRTAMSLMLDHRQDWLACVDDNGVYLGGLAMEDLARFLGRDRSRDKAA
ncbi:MAG: ABC transporter ATP-binding protein [Castellaniella sp.]